jgi:hypothetical protein
MKDVTIVIQGKITQETYNFYVEKYPNFNIVVSTWSNHQLDLSHFPHNLKFISEKQPKDVGMQNMNLQFLSTINGLFSSFTPYCIKVRGDEYYTNLEYVAEIIKSDSGKIYTSPIWFRHWDFMNYHVSDHLMAGTTDNLKTMFFNSKINMDRKALTHMVDGVPHTYWEPEINLTRSYLMAKYKDEFFKRDGRELMIESFNILDLENLKPYKIVANVYNKNWTDNYIPEDNLSISNINQLLEPNPFKI